LLVNIKKLIDILLYYHRFWWGCYIFLFTFGIRITTFSFIFFFSLFMRYWLISSFCALTTLLSFNSLLMYYFMRMRSLFFLFWTPIPFLEISIIIINNFIYFCIRFYLNLWFSFGFILILFYWSIFFCIFFIWSYIFMRSLLFFILKMRLNILLFLLLKDSLLKFLIMVITIWKRLLMMIVIMLLKQFIINILSNILRYRNIFFIILF